MSRRNNRDRKHNTDPSNAVPGSVRIESHFHTDERGVLVRCYHESKNLLTNWRFWAGMTLGFPAEHLLWEKVFPFYLITHWMGL
jgi:hypothetical protein